jgi:ABC-type phosphate/phosphonate transport system substrate-binding protein
MNQDYELLEQEEVTEDTPTFAIYYQESKNEDRKECQVVADNIEKALGMFFMQHVSINYNNVIDHMEI